MNIGTERSHSAKNLQEIAAEMNIFFIQVKGTRPGTMNSGGSKSLGLATGQVLDGILSAHDWALCQYQHTRPKHDGCHFADDIFKFISL